MKHIAVIFIIGAVLQGCSENRSKAVSTKPGHKVQTQAVAASAPAVSAQNSVAEVSAKTPARKQAHRQTKPILKRHSAIRNDKVTSGQAAPVVAVHKKPLHAMTFNEAQFSDKASTFPRTQEALKLEEEKYKE